MPQSSLRYVLVYALERPDGVSIIDAGWDTEDAWAALNAGLGKAGYEIGDVKSVLVTHIHPDHFGLAGRVRDASDAPIALHPADAEMLPQRYVQMDDLIDPDARAPPRVRRAARLDGHHAGRIDAGPPVRERAVLPDVLLEDGDHPDVPGLGAHRGVDARALARAPVLLRRHPQGADVGRPRPAPHHPQHLLPPPTDAATRWPTSSSRSTGWPSSTSRSACPPTSTGSETSPPASSQLQTHHEHRLTEIRAALANQPGATAWEIAMR